MLPNELIKLNQWVCYGVDQDNPKMPFNPNSLTPAKAGEPATWGSYQAASIQRVMGKAKGVGFEFDGNGLVGIDLDHCRDPVTGEVDSWAQQIVNDFNSFSEISLSGTGLHIFIKGKKPGENCKKVLDKDTGAAIEIYENGRYFAMTGNVYHQAAIAERTAQLKVIYDRVWPVEPVQTVQTPSEPPKQTPTLDYYLYIGLERDSKLQDLWNGQRDSPDESSNDQALMNKLAYWLNRDKAAMIKAFRESPFAAQKDESHKKKIQREDYLNRTADGAIANCRSTAAEDDTQFKAVHDTKPISEQSHKGLDVISAQQLQNTEFAPVRYLIKGILPVGTSLIAAASKIGKSWLVLAVGLTIAAGDRFWGRQTEQCGVLYLALEDQKHRLKDRMDKVLNGKPAPDKFYFATRIPNLDNGFLDVIEDHLQQYPDTGLIIIDTLQKIRGKSSAGMSYSLDYSDIGRIKEYMDDKGVSVLFVHHTRKMKDKYDPFNMISGTTGIMGAADTVFVITKSRHDINATLFITGRDVAESSILMHFNKDTYQWDLVGNARQIETEKARKQYDDNLVVQAVKALLAEATDNRWSGTAGKLLEAGAKVTGAAIAETAQAVGYALRDLTEPLYNYDKIVYEPSKNGNAGLIHEFRYEVSVVPKVGTGTDDDDYTNIEF